MRIALIRQRYNPYGGAERFVQRAMASLERSASLELRLIARDWEGEAGTENWVRCDPFYFGRTWRDWSFARAACREVARGRYDLVQSHERLACCDIFRAGDGVHAQWLLNRQRVLGAPARWAQCASPWHRYILASERRLFASPRLRAVICNSQMVVGEIRRHFGIEPAKLHVIYNGVDLSAFRPEQRGARQALRTRLDIPAGALVFLFVGSGFERKGVACLLQAFARAYPGKTAAYLLIVGADRKAAELRSRARQLKIEQRVHFAGPQREILPWYAAADCLVLPTLYDPFPNVVLEALACGLPVLTSQQCGAAELLEQGNTGWVCDALDADGFARHMAGLDAVTARHMGEAARALAERFPLDRMAGELLALYSRLLAQN